jgi:hypothetical protein
MLGMVWDKVVGCGWLWVWAVGTVGAGRGERFSLRVESGKRWKTGSIEG